MSRLIQSSIPGGVFTDSSSLPSNCAYSAGPSQTRSSSNLSSNLSSTEPSRHPRGTGTSRIGQRRSSSDERRFRIDEVRSGVRQNTMTVRKKSSSEFCVGRTFKDLSSKGFQMMTTTASSGIGSFQPGVEAASLGNNSGESAGVDSRQNHSRDNVTSLTDTLTRKTTRPNTDHPLLSSIASQCPSQSRSQCPSQYQSQSESPYHYNSPLLSIGGPRSAKPTRQPFLSFPTQLGQPESQINSHDPGPMNKTSPKHVSQKTAPFDPPFTSHVAFSCSESSQESFFDSEHTAIHRQAKFPQRKTEVPGRIGTASVDRGRMKTTGTEIYRGSSLHRSGVKSSVFDYTRSPGGEKEGILGQTSESHPPGDLASHREKSEPTSYLKQRLNALHAQQRQATEGSNIGSKYSNSSSPTMGHIPSNESFVIDPPNDAKPSSVDRDQESVGQQHMKTEEYSLNRKKDILLGTPESPLLGQWQDDHTVLPRLEYRSTGRSSNTAEMDNPSEEETKRLDREKGREVFENHEIRQEMRRMSSEVIARPNKTRSQLAELQEKIIKFEGQLHQETEHRKAAGEGRLNVLREALGSLEKTLSAEVRRRVDANKTIQMGFEEQLTLLEAKVDQSLEERSSHVSSAIESLSSRLRVAESGAKEAIQVQGKRLRQLADEIEVVASEIHRVKKNISSELQARRQRGEIISDKLAELEKQIESRVTIEQSVRERDVGKLNEKLEELKNRHVSLDESFQHDLSSRFLELKTALKEETQAREQADDDIVQALNHYTVALQSALRIANST